MSAPPLLDANVLLRHLTQDHPEQSERASAYLARVEQGEFRVRLVDTVIFETVFTLQRFYGQSRSAIRDALLPLIELPGIELPGKRRLRRAFALYVDHNLSFADAYHATLVEGLNLPAVVSFDRGLDRVPGPRRIEP
jgi:predicted nucleic acid-binding protein